jgi:hypothetical protein
MGTPVSLRNIPPHALRLAHHLSEQTGLSMADLLRQAVVTGLLVEATKFAPNEEGTFGGCDPVFLAKALRRHLSSAIDLLIEYGEHPHQVAMEQGEKPHQENNHILVHTEALTADQQERKQSSFFEHAIGDDLEMLGIGISMTGTVENKDILSEARNKL